MACELVTSAKKRCNVSIHLNEPRFELVKKLAPGALSGPFWLAGVLHNSYITRIHGKKLAVLALVQHHSEVAYFKTRPAVARVSQQ